MNDMTKPQKGVNRSDAVSYQELLDQEARPVPAILRLDQPGDFGLEPIKASRYTSEAFFKEEIDNVFLKSWQYACRVEELPNPGDTYVLDLVGHSALVVRQRDGSLKALRNVCLHRGRKLLTSGGCKNEFRCMYHGLTWNTDGTFRENPMKWDFPQIDEAKFGLPEIRVDTWGGFIFVNWDKDPQPLAEVVTPLPEHFERWNIEDSYKAAHVAKLVPANWKAVAEAFLESHHVLTTHPQMSTYVADGNSQYDVLSEHVTRFVSPMAVASPLIDNAGLTEEKILQNMLRFGGQTVEGPLLQEGQTARRFAADAIRQMLTQETHIDHSQYTDSEVVDGISYHLFPNFGIWGGFSAKIGYRWRPHNLRVDQTLMEVFLFKQCPAGEPRPAPAAMRMLGEDEPWSMATELEALSGVYDQDQGNLGPVQEGLRDLGEDGVIHFGAYSEIRCRHLHMMVDKYIARASSR